VLGLLGGLWVTIDFLYKTYRGVVSTAPKKEIKDKSNEKDEDTSEKSPAVSESTETKDVSEEEPVIAEVSAPVEAEFVGRKNEDFPPQIADEPTQSTAEVAPTPVIEEVIAQVEETVVEGALPGDRFFNLTGEYDRCEDLLPDVKDVDSGTQFEDWEDLSAVVKDVNKMEDSVVANTEEASLQSSWQGNEGATLGEQNEDQIQERSVVTEEIVPVYLDHPSNSEEIAFDDQEHLSNEDIVPVFVDRPIEFSQEDEGTDTGKLERIDSFSDSLEKLIPEIKGNAAETNESKELVHEEIIPVILPAKKADAESAQEEESIQEKTMVVEEIVPVYLDHPVEDEDIVKNNSVQNILDEEDVQITVVLDKNINQNKAETPSEETCEVKEAVIEEIVPVRLEHPEEASREGSSVDTLAQEQQGFVDWNELQSVKDEIDHCKEDIAARNARSQQLYEDFVAQEDEMAPFNVPQPQRKNVQEKEQVPGKVKELVNPSIEQKFTNNEEVAPVEVEKMEDIRTSSTSPKDGSGSPTITTGYGAIKLNLTPPPIESVKTYFNIPEPEEESKIPAAGSTTPKRNKKKYTGAKREALGSSSKIPPPSVVSSAMESNAESRPVGRRLQIEADSVKVTSEETAQPEKQEVKEKAKSRIPLPGAGRPRHDSVHSQEDSQEAGGEKAISSAGIDEQIAQEVSKAKNKRRRRKKTPSVANKWPPSAT